MAKDEIDKMVDDFKQRLADQIGKEPLMDTNVSSREYKQFKKELTPPHLGLYEKACNMAEGIFKVKMKKEKEEEMLRNISISHLSITPYGAMSLSIILPVCVIMFGIVFGFLLMGSTFFAMFFVMMGAAMIIPLQKFPDYLANSWRMKASNQMVLAVFYIVTYMRHTSNLELAIEFASDHLTPPLSLDMKKVLWDVETEKYESIKESLDMYLETWRKWNMEFVEAMHLIESSLYEPSDERRLSMLDKSLSVILEETFEKMLHFAQNLKSPITMLHMLGVILPVLGLVVLPLVVSFMEGVAWYHLAALYNVILPVTVYYMGKNILAKRPTGYGDTDISEENPELKKYRNMIFHIGKREIQVNPLYLCIFVFAVLFFLSISPLIIHFVSPDFDIVLAGTQEKGVKFFDYSATTGNGPFGVGAAIISLFFPLAVAISLGLYFYLKSKNLMKMRENSKRLETEFASALFQLGNRLGDGIPAEIAFDKVAGVMQDTVSGKFFGLVSANISRLGMGVREAIFHPKVGALVHYPSSVIESSMKVLIEGLKKGPVIAAQALMSIARYIKEIHKVDERLKDLMADVISSMKSQINFMAPAISGIVIGITSMITNIIGKLSGQLGEVVGGDAQAGALGGLTSMFGEGIPTYYFQIVVGIYVVQITYVLTIMSNGIENGSDKLNERYQLGRNLIKSTLIYIVIAGVVMLLFNSIATKIMLSTIQ